MADIRDFVTQHTGAFYRLLFSNRYYFFLILLLIVLIVLFFKVREYSKSKRFKKMDLISTNDWWSWDEYEKKKEKK